MADAGAQIRYWTYSAKGKRRTMEDKEVVARDPHSGFCIWATCDGHGGHGAVDKVRPWIAPAIVAALRTVAPGPDGRFDAKAQAELARALQLAVVGLDQRLYAELRGANRNSGCTLCLAAFHPASRLLTLVNCGDSRGVVWHPASPDRAGGAGAGGAGAGGAGGPGAGGAGGKGDTKSERILVETEDHKPTLPREQERIARSGGVVIGKRVAGTLALSRGLGDLGHGLKRRATSRSSTDADTDTG